MSVSFINLADRPGSKISEMVDLSSNALQVYNINVVGDVQQSIKHGKLSVCTFVESASSFETSKDIFDTRRRIIESDVVVVLVNEVFNDNNQFQYELAWAVQLDKPLVVLTDNTTLPSVFEGSWLCNEDINANPQWIHNVQSSIHQLLSRETNTGDNERILQFIWSIEETVILPTEESAERTAVPQDEDSSATSTTNTLENDEITNTFICSLLNRSEENIASKVNKIPLEIKRLCEKHQKSITKGHIRQIGRNLGLDDEHLKIVESFYEHGIPEMFWQLVKIWHDVSPEGVSAKRLKKALRECNIHTHETCMPTKHSRVLGEMTEYFVNNIVDIHHLLPFLISERVLCPVTRAYVTAPMTRDQKILRLLEILSTRQRGMFMFVNVLRKSGNGFLADRICEKLPELWVLSHQKPSLAVPPSPRSSCSSSETSLKSYSLRSAPSLHHQSLLSDYASETSLNQIKRPVSMSSAPSTYRILSSSTTADREGMLFDDDDAFESNIKHFSRSAQDKTCGCRCIIL